jgi:hypothetical protein
MTLENLLFEKISGKIAFAISIEDAIPRQDVRAAGALPNDGESARKIMQQ